MQVWQIVVIIHLLALPDIWTSRLTTGAKVLWSLTIAFIPIVGLGAWILTRHTARQPAEAYHPKGWEEAPGALDDEPAKGTAYRD
jgi:hypothetical protein